MTKQILFPKYLSNRNHPINLEDDDQKFFENEFVRSIPNSHKWAIKNILMTKDGVVFKNFRLFIPSIYSERISFEFGLKYRFKNLIGSRIKIYQSRQSMLCFDSWYQGYFHWVAECLPRYYVGMLQYPQGIFFIPKHVERYHYDSLMAIGLKAAQLVPIENTYRVNLLHVFSRLAPSGNYNDRVMQEMANAIRINLKENVTNPSRRIYVSRRKAKTRKILNESDVIKELKKHEFEIMYLEDVNFFEQVHIFSETNIFVSIHGGGLTNMMFMNRSAKVLEIRKEGDASNLCYYSMANTHTLDYYYLFGIPVDREQNVQQADLHVPLEKLKEVLSQITA